MQYPPLWITAITSNLKTSFFTLISILRGEIVWHWGHIVVPGQHRRKTGVLVAFKSWKQLCWHLNTDNQKEQFWTVHPPSLQNHADKTKRKPHTQNQPVRNQKAKQACSSCTTNSWVPRKLGFPYVDKVTDVFSGGSGEPRYCHFILHYFQISEIFEKHNKRTIGMVRSVENRDSTFPHMEV
jgi:hypothetical protein